MKKASVFVLLMILAMTSHVIWAADFVMSREAQEKKQPERKYYVTPQKEDDPAPRKKEEFFSEEPSSDVTAAEPPLVDIEPANSNDRQDQISKAAKHHAKTVVAKCPGNWETPSCLEASSDTFLTLSALYAEDLENTGHKNEVANIKEHCAASTVATHKKDIPAYAMRSAFVECVNEIYDITERTSIKPDIELYQLMVMSVLCLDKDMRCGLMEMGLKASTRKM